MKNAIMYLFGLLLAAPLSAQDLADHQKLRGEVIASQPDDDYLTHAANAFDGNEATCFKAKESNGWVGLDLKTACAIACVRVLPRADRAERMNGCLFQGANDPAFAEATDLFTVTETPEVGIYTTYEWTNTEKFRFVRCLAPTENCNMAELEFYGETGEQPVDYPQLTNLPTIYLETGGAFSFTDKSSYVAAQVVVVLPDSTGVFDARTRGRGNSSWDFMDKKSFRIKFDKKQHFLGLPANAKNWTLIACAVDKTLLRNGLAFEMSRALEFEYTPPCAMVDVVLDGFYYGTFMASDHIDVNKNRIDIDEMSPDDILPPQITGGYHLEIDAYAYLEPVYFNTLHGLPFTIKSPESEEIHPSQREWIENHIGQTEEILFQSAEEAMEKYIDVESAAKYYLLSELTGNCDSYWCIPCYKKRGDDKLYFGPVWDYDQAFLTNERVPRYFPTLDTQHGVAQPWFRQMMTTPAMQKAVSRWWKKLKRDNFKQALIDYLDDQSALLHESQALNYERWRSINRKVWFEDALFETYGEYIAFVKQFIEDRFAWFDEICPPVDRKALLPASTPENPLHIWRYTFDEPAEDWQEDSFDDGEWLSGPAPFGREQDLQNTDWQTPQIYIRTTFSVDPADLSAIEQAWFYLFHDENCRIYLNGRLALEREGYITNYQFFAFDRSLLREGENTLAIHCTQTSGGQLIDVGVYIDPVEEQIPTAVVLPASSPCSWTIEGNRLRLRQMEEDAVAHLYGIDGRLLDRRAAAGGEYRFALPARGMYLLRLPNRTIKIRY
jgi:hypothetical protein